MIIYTEEVLNLMLQRGLKSEVSRILEKGIHRNRDCGNYVIVAD